WALRVPCSCPLSLRFVETALLGLRVLPPPAAGADVFAGLDRAGAGRASQARIALVVQRVVGDLVRAHVVPGLRLRPLHERVHLHDAAVAMVDLDRGQDRARDRLLAAQAGAPGVEGRERAVERLHLADAAATLALLHALPEREEALLVLELLGGLALREVDLDLRAVGHANPLHHVVGLRGQAAGVEGEDTRVLVELREHVDDGHVFHSEARCERDAVLETVERPVEDLLGRPGLRAARDVVDFGHGYSQAHRDPPAAVTGGVAEGAGASAREPTAPTTMVPGESADSVDGVAAASSASVPRQVEPSAR